MRLPVQVALLALLLISGPVYSGQGERFPALYQVLSTKGVAVFPSSEKDAEVNEYWVPQMGQIEAIGTNADRSMLRISTPRGESWVSPTNLTRVSQFDPVQLPKQLSCQGVQPTWILTKRNDAVFVDFLDGYLITLAVGPDRKPWILSAHGDDGTLEAKLSAKLCRIPNSEFEFGLSVEMQIRTFGPEQALSGCCSLRP